MSEISPTRKAAQIRRREDNKAIAAQAAGKATGEIDVGRKIDKAIAAPLPHLQARIVNATTPEEAHEWSKVRDELIKQEIEIENQQHRLFLERGLFWSKQVFSYAAIVGGTILAMKGFDTLGYFIIGGGLYQVAPGYMRAIINKYKTEENDDDSGEK